MSNLQDIYVAGSKNRPAMLTKDNYVPWSSRLLPYAKSRSNGKLVYNSIINGPYTNDELNEKELKHVEVDDQAIQTILLGFDIGIQKKKAKLFNEWERSTSTDGESIESYYHRFPKLMNDFKRNKHFPEKIARNLKNQNPNGNGNVVAAQAEGNAIRNNSNQIRCYNCRGLGHLARNCTVRPKRRDAAYLHTQLLIAQKEEA
nr:hypothetical protein [Tanacetum cinerariifolium]